MRRVLKTALKDLLLLALLLAAGEAGLRLFYPQAARHLFTGTITGGHRIVHNSHGLRDNEFPAQKPEGERRILCLGDSTTYGAGIAMEDAYPKQLERLLNGQGGTAHWRVINAGGQGASVTSLTRFMREKGLGFGPETVVLGFSPTMISVAGQLENAGPPQKLTIGRRLYRELLALHARLHGTYLYSFIDASVRRRLYRLGILKDRMDHPEGALAAYAFDVPGVDKAEVERNYAVFERELSELKQLLDEHNVRFLVLGLPSRFRLSSSRADNERGYDLSKIRIEPLERVDAACSRLVIPFVNLQPKLAAAGGELYIPSDYAHLNETGMKLAADELLPRLQPAATPA